MAEGIKRAKRLSRYSCRKLALERFELEAMVDSYLRAFERIIERHKTKDNMHLGYYVHLHGKGHAQRARAIAQNLSIPVTFIGTGVSRSDWTGVSNYQLLDLPPDRVENVPNLPINDRCQTYSFHYAPYYSDTYRQRAVAIANWVEQTNPTAVVVDVSTEITQYLRLLGVPVIGVRQHGDRSDFPHLCGYDSAYRLFTPYPEILESMGTPSWIRDKTIYSPGFSRYSLRQETKLIAREKLNIASVQRVVSVINGKGGGKHSVAKIIAAATVTPQWRWLIVGEVDTDLADIPDNISLLGWREDTYLYLKAADVAIASGGHNTVMEIGTARVPFLCIPEPRPFDEQLIKAKLLESLGLCLVETAFPSSNSVEFILDELRNTDVSQWDRIMAVDGAAQAAKAIESEVRVLANYLNSAEPRLVSTEIQQ